MDYRIEKEHPWTGYIPLDLGEYTFTKVKYHHEYWWQHKKQGFGPYDWSIDYPQKAISFVLTRSSGGYSYEESATRRSNAGTDSYFDPVSTGTSSYTVHVPEEYQTVYSVTMPLHEEDMCEMFEGKHVVIAQLKSDFYAAFDANSGEMFALYNRFVQAFVSFSYDGFSIKKPYHKYDNSIRFRSGVKPQPRIYKALEDQGMILVRVIYNPDSY